MNRTKEGEMGRGEIGPAGRSVGQLDWIGLASQAVGGWAVGVPDSWDPTMGVALVLVSCVAAQCVRVGPVPTPVCSVQRAACSK